MTDQLDLTFLILGFFVGGFGTLIGAGGGFFIVPILLLVFHRSPQMAVGTSLVMVFFNALSGTWRYASQRTIDFRSGWKFAVATIPGAFVGAWLSRAFSLHVFRGAFGLLLIGVGLFMVLRPRLSWNRLQNSERERGEENHTTRTLTNSRGETYTYSFNEGLGILLSVLIGFLASIFGIGGGVIHVPLMIYLLQFPVHVATATSHFILVVTAASGSVFHVIYGHVDFRDAFNLSVGAVFGAQLGALLSPRTRGQLIVRLAGFALAATGVRMIYLFFQS